MKLKHILAMIITWLIWHDRPKANAIGFMLLWIAIDHRSEDQRNQIESITRRQAKFSKLLRKDLDRTRSTPPMAWRRHRT